MSEEKSLPDPGDLTQQQKVLRLLQQVRHLFSDPSKFTTGTLARNADGKAVGPYSQEATCYSVAGALLWATRQLGESAFDDNIIFARVLLAAKASKMLGSLPKKNSSITNVNDGMGYLSVLQLLDLSISGLST